MNFYAFKLEQIHVKSPRSKGLDDDVVTFGVLVNQQDRGHGTGFFPLLGQGHTVRASAVPPKNRKNMNQLWEVGPFEIAPGDQVSVFYTGTNTSDEHNINLDTEQQDKIELKILDSILSAAVGTIGGPVGAVIGAIVGQITDPVGKIIGFEPPVRCDGPVFSDAVPFSGSGLDNLSMTPFPLDDGHRPGISFTKSYTDAANHDTKCGDIAETDITFSVIRVPFISVRSLRASRFPDVSPTTGLRQLAEAGGAISIKSLLGVRP
jgi:hypothetical protein